MFRFIPRRLCAFAAPTPISVRGTNFSDDLENTLHKVATERAYLLPQWGTTAGLEAHGYKLRDGELGVKVTLSNGTSIEMFNAAQCTHQATEIPRRDKLAYLTEPVNPAGRQFEPHVANFLGSLRATNPVEYSSNHWIHSCDLRRLGWMLRDGAAPVAMPQEDSSAPTREYYHASQVATPLDYGLYFNPRVRLFNVHTGLKFGLSVTALQHLVEFVVPHFAPTTRKGQVLSPHYYVSDATLQRTLKGQALKDTEPLCLSTGKMLSIDYYWHASQTDVPDKVVAMGEAARARVKARK